MSPHVSQAWLKRHRFRRVNVARDACNRAYMQAMTLNVLTENCFTNHKCPLYPLYELRVERRIEHTEGRMKSEEKSSFWINADIAVNRHVNIVV